MCIDQMFCLESDEDNPRHGSYISKTAKPDPEKDFSELEYQGHKNVSTLVIFKQIFVL